MACTNCHDGAVFAICGVCKRPCPVPPLPSDDLTVLDSELWWTCRDWMWEIHEGLTKRLRVDSPHFLVENKKHELRNRAAFVLNLIRSYPLTARECRIAWDLSVLIAEQTRDFLATLPEEE